MDRTDRSINGITAVPVRYGEETANGWYCRSKSARDALSPDELDIPCGCMSNPMHLDVPTQGYTAKSWWEAPALLRVRFTRNQFVLSVLEHWADRVEPPRSDPRTWGDLYHPKLPGHQSYFAANNCQIFHDGIMTREDDGRESWVLNSGTPESGYGVVRSVVKVLREARSLTDHPKYKAKMDEIFKIYEDVLIGKPCTNPTVRGPFGEATIPLIQRYRTERHRSFLMKGGGVQAMVKTMTEFMERGWMDQCSSEWACPCFVVSEKVVGEWRLVLDCRDLNSESHHNAYPLPLINNLLQKQQGKRIFTIVDLRHGYHQMPLVESSQDSTAMLTPFALMRWKVMPLGLKNGNAQFQRMTEDVLREVDSAYLFVDEFSVSRVMPEITEDELIDTNFVLLSRSLTSSASIR